MLLGDQRGNTHQKRRLDCHIDVKESRYIVVTDIPGAFLHAAMEDDVHMSLEGTITELIIKL